MDLVDRHGFGHLRFVTQPISSRRTPTGQEKIYGDRRFNALTLGNTAFTTLDKDGDGDSLSATDKDTSTTTDVATYENEIEILSPVAGTPGSGDGFRESNYDITYISGDLTFFRMDKK